MKISEEFANELLNNLIFSDKKERCVIRNYTIENWKKKGFIEHSTLEKTRDYYTFLDKKYPSTGDAIRKTEVERLNYLWEQAIEEIKEKV